MILALSARAKLNLNLKVVGRRPDGFHDIETTFQAISLHDLLEVSSAGETVLEVSGNPVPADPSNLILRAHAAAQEAAGRELPTRFRLMKRIPAGAGLGGGSSDAACALRALAALHGLQLDLATLARGLGADVPFFLRGGRAAATGRGDELRPLPESASWFAIAWPGFEISTQAVYEAWDRAGDGLEEAAALTDSRLVEFRRRLGGDWRLTGTGSAFFLPCSTAQAAAEAVAGLDCWTAVAHSVPAWA